MISSHRISDSVSARAVCPQEVEYTRESNRRVQIVSLPPDQIGSTNAPLYSAQRTRYLKMWCWPLGSRKVSGRDLNSPQSMVRWRRLTGGRARPFDYVLAASIDINPSAAIYSQSRPKDRES